MLSAPSAKAMIESTTMAIIISIKVNPRSFCMPVSDDFRLRIMLNLQWFKNAIIWPVTSLNGGPCLQIATVNDFTEQPASEVVIERTEHLVAH